MTNAAAPFSVLLVDPCPDTTATLSTLLELAGFKVRAVSGGIEALHDPMYAPDAVVLELNLRGMDGCELARRFAARAYPPWLIAYTSSSEDADFRRSADAGIHVHVVKPAVPNAVVDVIRRLSEVVSACVTVG